MLDSSENDIKSRLINSSDAKIAEAARRVFGSSFNECLSTDPLHSASPTTHGFHTSHLDIPMDIQRAASAVAMLAPKNRVCDMDGTDEGIFLVRNMSQCRSINSSSRWDDSENSSCQESNQVERLVRSRERNKMHARKTRQRKKEHMDTLEKCVDSLKSEQISLQMAINEKATANILLGMFSADKLAEQPVDPLVDVLLKRKAGDIPDAASIPDLPALILPVHSNKKRTNLALDNNNPHMTTPMQEYPDDGIDYELLGKDRSLCTSEELDRIRKERNRMHAKRTRDRKRVFMESMQDIVNNLQHENDILRKHLLSIGGSLSDLESDSQGSLTPALISPALKPASTNTNVIDSTLNDTGSHLDQIDRPCDHEKSIIDAGSIVYNLVAISQENLHGLTIFTTDSRAASPVCTSAASSCCNDSN